MASCSRAGACCAFGRLRWRLSSTRAWTELIQAAKSASAAIAVIGVAARGAMRFTAQWLEDFSFEDFHLLLRERQALPALPRELEAALVRRQRLLEGQAAVFHLRHQSLELGQGLLEARLRGCGFLLAHTGGCHHNRAAL